MTVVGLFDVVIVSNSAEFKTFLLDYVHRRSGVYNKLFPLVDGLMAQTSTNFPKVRRMLFSFCCECMETDVPFAQLFCARKEELRYRMTHAHVRSDCALNKEQRLTDC